MDFNALSSLRFLCGLAVYPEFAEATEGPSRRPFISVFSLLPFSFEVAEATEGPSRRPFISVFSLLPFSFVVAEVTEGPSRRPFISFFSLLPFSFLLLTCPIWFRLRRAVDDSSETTPHSSGRIPLDAAAAKMSFAQAA